MILYVIYVSEYLNKYDISANSMGIIDFINNHLNLFFEFLRNKSFTNQELESLVPGKDYSHVEEQKQVLWNN